MAREKFSSPRISFPITPAVYDDAKQSDSGKCVLADGIRAVYPRPLAVGDVDVNVATISIRDREEGVTYTYLTPAVAQQFLLAFDQGWPNTMERFSIKNAVKITRIRKAGENQLMTRAEQRAAKRLDLENRELAGEPLTGEEKRSLTRMRNARPAPERPQTFGPAEVEVIDGQPVVEGGVPLKRPRNVNLLSSRHRIFGAKVADPGQAFRHAVDKAVREREQARAE